MVTPRDSLGVSSTPQRRIHSGQRCPAQQTHLRGFPFETKNPIEFHGKILPFRLLFPTQATNMRHKTSKDKFASPLYYSHSCRAICSQNIECSIFGNCHKHVNCFIGLPPKMTTRWFWFGHWVVSWWLVSSFTFWSLWLALEMMRARSEGHAYFLFTHIFSSSSLFPLRSTYNLHLDSTKQTYHDAVNGRTQSTKKDQRLLKKGRSRSKRGTFIFPHFSFGVTESLKWCKHRGKKVEKFHKTHQKWI